MDTHSYKEQPHGHVHLPLQGGHSPLCAVPSVPSAAHTGPPSFLPSIGRAAHGSTAKEGVSRVAACSTSRPSQDPLWKA